MKDSSNYTGAVNSDNSSGQIYVEIESGSTWTLTGDSYISGLTCDADAINLNGYTLYVNGEEYKEGSSSTGEAIEIEVKESSDKGMGGAPEDMPNGEAPSGDAPSGEKPDGEAPSGDKPDGNGQGGDKPSGNPPEKPSN